MKQPKGAQARTQRRLIDKKPAFLAAFAECGSLQESANACGIDRSTHYDWLDEDPAYVIAFAEARVRAGGMLRDLAVEWVKKGIFEPTIYKGKFSYASRRRILCKLANGTTAFEDELPKNAKVAERKTVITQDGEMIGVYHRSEGLLGKLLSAHLPEEFGARAAVDLSGKLEVTDDPEDARRELLRKLAGLVAAAAITDSDKQP